MNRIDNAGLMAMAYHDPPRLAAERRAALADAGPKLAVDETLRRAEQMTNDIIAGKVLLS